MIHLFRAYSKLLTKYPLGMQALQAGALMGLGDQIAQNVIEKRSIKHLDFKRTAQFFAIGFFIAGPTTRTWYGTLERYFGSRGASVALKKVSCDQLFFAPSFIIVLLSTIGLLQGNSIESVKLKLQDQYTDVLINNYKLWPLVQLVNFYLIPLNYQVLVVQSVAVLWNTYISYKTNQGDDLKNP